MAAVLPRLVWHLDDLRVWMSYKNYSAARLARGSVTVVLAGVGGDEIFAGYPWRYGPIADMRNETAFEDTYFRAWNRLVPAADTASFFAPGVARALDLDRPREVFRKLVVPTKGWEPLDKALYVDARTFLHGLLVVEDRLAMAHGLESRVPFLDDEVVAVASAIPARYKLRGTTGKAILRDALSDMLPRATLDKPKQGFSPPDGSWYRGPTMQYVREVVLSERALARGLFEPRYLTRVVDEHLAGKVNQRLLLWSLLCFEWWNRLFIDGERP
jgi:asparagine synthase (glutamine-hydrolysing)